MARSSCRGIGAGSHLQDLPRGTEHDGRPHHAEAGRRQRPPEQPSGGLRALQHSEGRTRRQGQGNKVNRDQEIVGRLRYGHTAKEMANEYGLSRSDVLELWRQAGSHKCRLEYDTLQECYEMAQRALAGDDHEEIAIAFGVERHEVRLAARRVGVELPYPPKVETRIATARRNRATTTAVVNALEADFVLGVFRELGVPAPPLSDETLARWGRRHGRYCSTREQQAIDRAVASGRGLVAVIAAAASRQKDEADRREEDAAWLSGEAARLRQEAARLRDGCDRAKGLMFAMIIHPLPCSEEAGS